MAFGGPPSLQPSFRSDGPPEDLPSITPENYQSEAERQRSFVEPALNGINSYALARAGFFYTGEGSKVQCFKCGVTCSKWRHGDIPFNVHQQCNPCCPFLQTFACKRKRPRSEMVLCSHATVPEYQRRRMSLPVDGKDIVYTADYQLYREMTLWRLYSSIGVVQPVVLSFPANSMIDHNPSRGLVFEDNGATHSPSCDLTMPPRYPSPAQLPPVQSTQATDHSVVLVGNVSMPLQTHRYSAGVYKYPIQTDTSAEVNTFDDNDDNNKKLDHGKDEGKVCKICLSAAVECVYLPCGHAGACRSCVNEFKKSSSCCPFCNTSVISTPNIYFP